jgi:hypothetical protein
MPFVCILFLAWFEMLDYAFLLLATFPSIDVGITSIPFLVLTSYPSKDSYVPDGKQLFLGFP